MNRSKLVDKISAMRATVLEHSEQEVPFDRPRMMWLAIRKLGKPVVALNEPSVYDQWDQLVILYWCHRRANAKMAHKRLNLMRQRHLENGEEGTFEIFFDLVKKMLAPNFITPHGFNKPLSSFDHLDVFGDIGDQLSDVLNRDEPVILYAGTLLGHVRDGRPIAFDDDIDVAVFLGEQKAENVPAVWHQYKRDLAEKGLLSEKWAGWKTPVIKLTSTLGVTIDLFPCWADAGKFSVYPYSWGDIATDVIFPLEDFRTSGLKLPAKSEVFLEQCYGPTWRIPDPLFHFDWDAANRKFHLLKSHNYSVALPS